jgi:hypothetical protein
MRSRHAQKYDAADFEALAAKYQKLNWRIIRRVARWQQDSSWVCQGI